MNSCFMFSNKKKINWSFSSLVSIRDEQWTDSNEYGWEIKFKDGNGIEIALIIHHRLNQHEFKLLNVCESVMNLF